jgi:preprotein translocase subunit SecD
MTQKQKHLLVLLGVLVLVGVSLYLIIGQVTRLGLDLQGGLEVVYKAELDNAAGGVPSSDQLDQTLSIIDRRVNGLGVTESQVQTQGVDQISISLPGVTDVNQALDIIGKTAQLKFFDDAVTRISGPAASPEEAIKQAQKSPNPEIDLSAKETAAIDKLAKGEKADEVVVVSAAPGKAGNGTETQYFVYKNAPAMTGSAIKSAKMGYDQQNRPNVQMEFTDEGGKQFEKVTKQLADRGSLKGTNQSFAIVLDNQMESDPIVDYNENPFGIAGGSAEINGTFTTSEAKDLALVLNTGALPVRLVQITSQEVSATLGKESLRQGLIAGAAGLVIVLIYMIAFYRFLGVIADIALVVYGILLWGLFIAIPVTLTLPGIAGMILTIGVAADANVVIFERIKEEVRHGRTVRSAISAGYSRGFRTILDANVLILLTALVIFMLATAQPKGFAFTLMLGVLVSMLTAVLATRAMLGLLSDYGFFNKASFMGVKASQIEDPPDEKRGPSGRARRTSTARRKKAGA